MASFSNYFTDIRSNEFTSSSISKYITNNSLLDLKKLHLLLFQVFLFLIFY
jgi:hypothetical protein